MKTLPILLIILITRNFLPLYSYQSHPITQEIVAAIRSGDASKLSEYFDDALDITLPSLEGTYSKSQSGLLIKDFFSKNPPSSFVVDHEGSSDNGSLYIIGNYKSNASSFRTYILVKKLSGTYAIQQIQFDTD
jgi:hypothetical protein